MAKFLARACVFVAVLNASVVVNAQESANHTGEGDHGGMVSSSHDSGTRSDRLVGKHEDNYGCAWVPKAQAADYYGCAWVPQ
ncbi:hypothetical protein [Caballeronia sordidicola]|uniref:hypothetical protein n=1 Tax=Caballeronia sordidicola TaxID=196367 RepID=UPI0004CFFA4C|nr:hypothetical protein [Caballeronia sordidicola]